MRLFIATALLCTLPVLACAQDAPADGSKLSVPIIGNNGEPVGLVDMTDTPHGVLIVATFEAGALPAGEHAVHIHQTGDCSDTEKFEKAGGHYNPTSHEHGYMAANGPHAGDMPNMVVAEGGKTAVESFNPMIRFKDGDAPLFDDDGSALVVHAKADDYSTQPSGAAGDRIGCAELTAK